MTRQELEDKEQEEYLAEWLRKKKEPKRATVDSMHASIR